MPSAIIVPKRIRNAASAAMSMGASSSRVIAERIPDGGASVTIVRAKGDGDAKGACEIDFEKYLQRARLVVGAL